MNRPPLHREQVIRAIERRGPERVPMVFHIYAPPDRCAGPAEQVRQMLNAYPCDVLFYIQPMPTIFVESWGIPGYSWTNVPAPADPQGGIDSRHAIDDWSQLDEILDRWPDPNTATASPCPEDPFPRGDRYSAIHWWNCLYERAWHLRGMENLLMDFHLYPNEVHRLLEAITDFNCRIIRRARRELNVDGVWVTDDIGMQTGPMFSPEIFRKFIKPYYAKMFRTAHEVGCHFWLHSCGNIELFLDDLVEIGVDVIHPIQKYAMDQRQAAQRLAGRACVWAGMDMQKILPAGSPDDVRREVRHLIDTFDTSAGGCMLALGNVITTDVPFENVHALFDEAWTYGQAHRRRT